MSDLMPCDRCQHLFTALETITRYDDSGQISIATRICKGCSNLSGLLPDRYSVIGDSVEMIQEVEPEEFTRPSGPRQT